ncbi:MAG: methyltransferase domain-containing protein [Alphaproteobacteria bacterium]|nr:methyltransferase domain-containing protein [Alphaproteobacteria bacterium]
MENTDRFTGKAVAYTKGRPMYAQAALDFLKKQGINENARIADIGAGTGIFSKQLAQTGATVFAVEPNDDMRQTAKEYLDGSNARCIDGSAENTALPDHCVNFVSAAQAFHWFDKAAFRKECDRILVPDGQIILIWNIEVFGSDFFRDYGEILKRLTNEDMPQTNENNPYEFFFKMAESFLSDFRQYAFDNTLYLDEETFLYKSLSSSAAPGKDDPHYKLFSQELKKLFVQYQDGGKLTYPHETVLYIGK